MIDGSNPKPGTTQTEPAGKDDGSSTNTPSDTDQTSGIPIRPSGDDTKEKDNADITEAAKQLTDKLIEYAGKDKKSSKSCSATRTTRLSISITTPPTINSVSTARV